MKNNIERIADMWQKRVENEGSFFEFNYIGGDGWKEVTNGNTPTETSPLNQWRVTIPKKVWKPKGSDYAVDLPTYYDGLAAFGLMRSTQQQAEDLAKQIKTLALIDSYACEMGIKKRQWRRS